MLLRNRREREITVMNEKVLLEVKNIDKKFGTIRALTNVSTVIEAGEVHGLIGENGSGKSTLSSIIAGVQPATEGQMFFKGQSYKPSSALEANGLGICMLLQERGTFNQLSVAANIFIGEEKQFSGKGIVSLKKMNDAAKAALEAIGVTDIDPKTVCGSLTFEKQKLVEIARAYNKKPDILIVDETTTALSRKGRNLLYDLIEKLKKENKSVIFISHDIDEVMDKCDKVTVLRDGNKIETLAKKDFTAGRIRQLMVGREVSENFYRNDYVSSHEDSIALKVENLSCGILHDINFEIYKGEIFGIGGLTDCGMHELGSLLFGALKPDRGKVVLSNGTEIKNTRVAIENKMGYVEKDRDKEALMGAASIRDNICAPSLNKIQKKGFITNRAEKLFSQKYADEMSVKMESVKQNVFTLSGGNKQKVSVAKWIGFDADILIFDCPTRGIDIGVKAYIYQLLMKLKEQGKTIIMISEEMMEVIGMSDRIIVLKNGKISGEFKREQKLTESQLIEYVI